MDGHGVDGYLFGPPALTKGVDREHLEDEAALEKRIAKAQQELEAASAFDLRLVNDDLELAKQEAEDMVSDFMAQRFG